MKVIYDSGDSQSFNLSSRSNTRRDFIKTSLFATLGVTAGCSYFKSPSPLESAEGYIYRLSDLIVNFIDNEHNLAGFKSLASWEESIFKAEFLREDAELIQAAFYTEAIQKSQLRRTPLSKNSVREKLSKPLALEKYTQDSLVDLLKATKEKMANDATYNALIRDVIEDMPLRIRGRCSNSAGQEVSPWWCVVAIIIIIIIIL